MAVIRLATLGVSIAVWMMTGTAQAAGPSFDCSKAGNWAEKTICQDDELADWDQVH